MSDANIVPDSRAKVTRGGKPGPMGFMIPIFCANCGADGGMVPEEGTTFAFWLCNPCFAACGELTAMMVMPDEVYWQRLKEEQMERYGRLLTTEELIVLVEADASPLATLVKEQAR